MLLALQVRVTFGVGFQIFKQVEDVWGVVRFVVLFTDVIQILLPLGDVFGGAAEG
jgi:hypothetical protein